VLTLCRKRTGGIAFSIGKSGCENGHESQTMDYVIAPLPFAAVMFLGMLTCLEAGRRMGMRKLTQESLGALSGFDIVNGAVFTLFGLLLALTLSGAPARLDTRRQLVATEANAISTAYLRLDLLPSDSQPALREQFRKYVDSRLAAYSKLPDVDAAKAELAKSEMLQTSIWNEAVAGTRLPGAHPEAARLLIPALNDMIDITTTRLMAAKIHPPLIIFAFLFFVALVCSVLAGYGMAANKRRSWLHIIAFAMVVVLCVYVTLEIEYPRMGFVQHEAYDQVLVDVRESMK